MFNKIYVYYIYFLVYLNVCGINPKEHGVKQELVSLLQMYFTYNIFFWVLVKVTRAQTSIAVAKVTRAQTSIPVTTQLILW